MRMRSLMAFGFGIGLVALASSAQAAVLIEIDKSAQRMNVTRDGQELYSWPVSTGRGGYDTPSGSYTPFRMEADHYSKEWDDAPMPHSIFFTKLGHAIHGSFETKRLGSAASHGCVRISPANATTLFSLVKAEGMANVKVAIKGDIRLASRKPVPEDNAREPRIPAQRDAERAPDVQQPPLNYARPGDSRYAQPNAPQPPLNYARPYDDRYAQPQYGQPYGTQPNYAQQDYGVQAAQPYPRPRYVQPDYAPRPYYAQPRYDDEYEAPAPVYRRPRGLFTDPGF